MQHDQMISEAMRREMRKSFFDVSPDGLLLYLDPTIGQLENRKWGLAAYLNVAAGMIEIRTAEAVLDSISIVGEVGAACRTTIRRYFAILQHMRGVG